MARLVLDDRPLVVLPSLAVALGDLDEAVIVQQIHYWLEKKKNFEEGRYWVYNTKKAWLAQFPWIKSEKRLQRKFDHLKKVGILITDNFNRAKMDRTIWYSLDYEKLAELEQETASMQETNNDVAEKEMVAVEPKATEPKDNALSRNDQKRYDAFSETGSALGQNDQMEKVISTDSIKSNRPNALGQNDLTNTIRLPETTQETSTETTTTTSDDWGALQNNYAEVNSYCMITWGLRKMPMVMQNILNGYTKKLGPELVKHAIDLTIIQNPTHPSMKYAQAICDSWIAKNISNVEQAKQADEEYKHSKTQVQGKARPVVQKESLPVWAQPGYQEPEVATDPAKSAKIEELMSKIKGDKPE